MQERLQKLFERIETLPLTLGSLVTTFTAIVFVRIGIENYLESFPFRFADYYYYQFTDFFLSFLFTFLAILPIIVWAGKTTISRASPLALLSFLIIWTPPTIDEIVSRGAGLWSFYIFDSLSGILHRYLTFFGDQPDLGITYGIRIEIALVVILIAWYAITRTRSITRSVISALFLYTVLFVVATLPSAVTILTLGISKGYFAVTEFDVAALMLTPQTLFGLNPPGIESVLNINVSLIFVPLVTFLIIILGFLFFRSQTSSILKNIRIPQLLYHWGLFLLGGATVSIYEQSTFILNIFHILGMFSMLLAVSCAWLTSVVVNDLRDIAIDRISNPHRPLVTGAIDVPTYKTIGILLFAASILLAGLVSTQAALLLVLYQALAYLYSADPLRLKRLPIVATAFAAMASLLILFIGFIVFSTEKNISALPNSIPLLLFFAYLTIIPIKDFKDISGDRADGVGTLPVLWGEARAKHFIGAAIFTIFTLSPFILSLRSLSLLGLFFGTVGYWILQLSSVDHRYFSYRKLPGWFVLLAASYGAFLATALTK
jgi:4-hydroxybenzoate polyprenyltransferase